MARTFPDELTDACAREGYAAAVVLWLKDVQAPPAWAFLLRPLEVRRIGAHQDEFRTIEKVFVDALWVRAEAGPVVHVTTFPPALENTQGSARLVAGTRVWFRQYELELIPLERAASPLPAPALPDAATIAREREEWDGAVRRQGAYHDIRIRNGYHDDLARCVGARGECPDCHAKGRMTLLDRKSMSTSYAHGGGHSQSTIVVACGACGVAYQATRTDL
jgi:hypothetical protein